MVDEPVAGLPHSNLQRQHFETKAKPTEQQTDNRSEQHNASYSSIFQHHNRNQYSIAIGERMGPQPSAPMPTIRETIRDDALNEVARRCREGDRSAESRPLPTPTLVPP